MTPDSVEAEKMAPDSVVSQEMAPDSIESEEMAPEDSMDVAPESFILDSMDAALVDSMDAVKKASVEAEEIVLDSLLPESQPPPCDHCATTHDCNGVEACRLARRLAKVCACCGLGHSDYDLSARIMDGLDKFDCETYIPDVEKLQMDGDTSA
jgi:hypothetical protein